MKKWLMLAVCLTTLNVGIRGADKQRDWQTGKVLDTERNRYFAGVDTDDGIAIYKTYATFVIDAERYVYKTEERLHWLVETS